MQRRHNFRYALTATAELTTRSRPTSRDVLRYRLIVPDKVLAKDGVCVPVSMLATLKVPLNFSEPVAPANLPVPPVILATPLSVAVPAPSGTVADELTTNSASELPDPERVPLPLKLKPVFVAVVGT